VGNPVPWDTLNTPLQGRIQDLSEGGARFISEQKHPDLGTKFFKIYIFPVLH